LSPSTLRTYLAEFLGTLVLVFGGTTAVVAAGREPTAPVLLVAAFGFGLALLAGLYAFGEVSGGHFNPAVSLAMYLDGRLPSRDLVGFWVAQLAGGVAGSLILLLATNRDDVASTANVPVSEGTAFVIELTLTAVFVLVILQASRSERFGSSALLAIPLTLVMVHLAAVPFTGCSVNPARTFGPALVGDVWTGAWVYFVATPLGGALAWLIHGVVVRGGLAQPVAPVAEALEEPSAGEHV
jgi:aquaporin Z